MEAGSDREAPVGSWTPVKGAVPCFPRHVALKFRGTIVVSELQQISMVARRMVKRHAQTSGSRSGTLE